MADRWRQWTGKAIILGDVNITCSLGCSLGGATVAVQVALVEKQECHSELDR